MRSPNVPAKEGTCFGSVPRETSRALDEKYCWILRRHNLRQLPSIFLCIKPVMSTSTETMPTKASSVIANGSSNIILSNEKQSETIDQPDVVLQDERHSSVNAASAAEVSPRELHGIKVCKIPEVNPISNI